MKKCKILAFLLTLLFVFYAIPLNIYAELKAENETNETNEEKQTSYSYNYDDGTKEILNLREANTKHFRTPNGNYVALSFAQSVHFKNEDGEWEEINNALSPTLLNTYKNEDGRIRFAKKIGSSSGIYVLKSNNTKLTFNLLNANKGIEGVVENSDVNISNFLQTTCALDDFSSTVSYSEAYSGVDLIYRALGLNLSQTLVLREPSKNAFSASFELKLNGLTATQTVNGEIEIRESSGELLYTIPVPTAFDANGVCAKEGEVSLALVQESSKKYTLTLSVSEKYLSQETREYPVKVSQNLISEKEQTIQSTSYRPNENGELTTSMHSSLEENTVLVRQYLSFPNVPENSSITKAILTLDEEDVGENIDGVALYRLPSTIHDVPNDESMLGVSYREDGYSWDITDLVLENSSDGLELMFTTFSVNNSQSSSAGEVMPAAIILTYTARDGIEDYYPTSSYDVGIAGVAIVNHATGNLTFSIPTIFTSNHLLSYTPILFYQGYVGNNYFQGASTWSTPISNSALARGYKLSVHETILTQLSGPNIISSYMYMDADGTTHEFLPSITTDENNIYYDEDGLSLSMTISSNEITITDLNNTVKRFTKSSMFNGWILKDITDAEGNKIAITHNSAEQPTQITFQPYGSSAFVELEFFYENGALIAVYSPRIEEATLFRYSATTTGEIIPTVQDYLREVEYIVGGATADSLRSYYLNPSQNTGLIIKDKAQYEYDSNGLLISAKQISTDRELYFVYNSYNKVTELGERINNAEGQSVLFEYGTGFTDVYTSGKDDIISTYDDTVTRYIFDESNRAVSVYSFKEYDFEIYGATMGVYDSESNSKNNLKEQTVTGGSSTNYLLNSGFDIAGEDSLFAYWNAYENVYVAAADNGSPSCACLYPKNLGNSKIWQDVYLTAGAYTFSMQLETREGEYCTLLLDIYDSYFYDYYVSKVIPTKTSFSYGSNSFYSIEFTVPSDAVVRIEITAEPSDTLISGVCIDNIMLEKSIGASEYNYVQTSGFEDTIPGHDFTYATSVVNSFWENQDGGNINFAENYLFGKVLQIKGNNQASFAKTRVYEATAATLDNFDNDPTYFISNADINFILSGYAYTNYSSASTSAEFRIYAEFTYYQGGGQEFTRIVDVSFLRNCSTFQYASIFISGIPDVADIPEGYSISDYICLKSIDIYCDFSNQPANAVAYFDNISFINAANTAHEEYTYSKKGLLIEKKNQFSIDTYNYDENRRLFLHRSSDGSAEMYFYDSEKPYRVTEVVQYQRQKNFPDRYYPEIVTQYSYLNTGLVVSEISREVIQSSAVFDISALLSIECNASLEGIKLYYYTNPIDSLKVASEYIYYTDTNYYGAIQKESNGTDRSIYYHYTEDGRIAATINQYSGDGIAYSYNEKKDLVGIFPAKLFSSNGYTTVTNAESVQYTYDDANRLSTIATESTTYTFSYDIFSNNTQIQVGENTLVSYEYADYNGKLTRVNYGNGNSVEYGYDGVENLTKVWYTSNGVRTLAYEYEYTAKGQLVQIYDHINNTGTNYRYNESDQLIGEHTHGLFDVNFKLSSDYSYNDVGDLSYAWHTLAYTDNETPTLAVLLTSYSYDLKQRSFRVTNSSGGFSLVAQNAYDNLGRLSSQTFTATEGSNVMILDVDVTYRTFGNDQTDALVSAYTSTVTKTDGKTSTTTYTYTYDSKDNITKIVFSTGEEIRYYYDDLSQLIREDNGLLDCTYTYTYDNAGNITTKKVYALTSSNATPSNLMETYHYAYENPNWGDQLTAYRGETITYDAIGNPLSYYNGSHYTFTWTQGRRLQSATLDTKQMTFTYNDAGLRTSKTVNGVTTEYFYSGALLLAQQTGDEILLFYYDAYGSPIGFQYRNGTYASGVWEKYIYEKNLQGDIVAIYNNVGTALVYYTYDAWGNVTKMDAIGVDSTVASKNPLTYRGYYYDSDLELYYLQSRYYDQKIGRFINADAIGYLGANMDLNSYNLYAYCSNNPVMYTDPSGYFVAAALIGSVIAGILFAVGGKYLPDLLTEVQQDGFQLSDISNPWKENWKEYVIAGLEGAIIGAASGIGMGFGAAAFQVGSALSLTSIVSILGGVSTGSCLVGMGIYALETQVFGLEIYEDDELWQKGLLFGIRGALNCGAGLLIGIQGFYYRRGLIANEFVNEKNWIHGSVMRAYLKTPILMPIEKIMNGLFEEW